ncbi:unnamed protein product, partial [Cladocopium goreaui]
MGSASDADTFVDLVPASLPPPSDEAAVVTTLGQLHSSAYGAFFLNCGTCEEYGHANNEGPRKRKWQAQEAHPRPTEDPWKDTDWRDGRDDWFDGRPQVRNWEEDWEGPPSERPAGMKMSGGIFARAMGAIVRKDEDDGRGDVEPSKRRAVPKNVASRTLSQLGVLAEPRKSKVMLKEAPKGVK